MQPVSLRVFNADTDDLLFETTPVDGMNAIGAFLALARCPVFRVTAVDDEGDDCTGRLASLVSMARQMFAPVDDDGDGGER